MKNNNTKNFTKLTQKKGVSLIVLIVTIIVIIILAAAVILTVSKNNPIDSANEAKFKEDVRSFQDDLALSISKDYTEHAGKGIINLMQINIRKKERQILYIHIYQALTRSMMENL